MGRNKVVLFLTSILAFSATLAFGACENQGQGTVHTCSYTEEKAEDTYLKTAATCEGEAVYYKSCVCGEASETDTFEHGEALGHEYGEWMSNGNGTHTRFCEHDFAHEETKECRGGAATCTEQATCEDCGTKYGELEEHSFTLEKAEEKYLKSAATCTKKAVYYKSCVCGKASETDTFEHGELAEHSFTEEKAEDRYLKTAAECESKAVYYKSCSKCGEASETDTFEHGNVLGHNYSDWGGNRNGTHTKTCKRNGNHRITEDCSGGTATCTEQARCSKCGCKYGELAAHKFTMKRAEEKYLKSAATCESKAVYYKSCSCGAASDTDTFEYGDLGAHDYENHVCKTCGKKQGDDLAFSLNDEGNGYVVTGIGSCKDADLYIPETYNDLPVTGIKEYAFYENADLTSVTIGNSVISIGTFAFFNNTKLTSVTIGNSVISIGKFAFGNCTSLQYNEYDNACYLGNAEKLYLYLIRATYYGNRYSCNINEQCRVIADSAFFRENKNGMLVSVVIPNGVISIGITAFSENTKLASVVIPDSVVSIGNAAFSSCNGLMSVTIGSGVTSIGENAFAGSSKLVEVYNLSTFSIKKGYIDNGRVAENALDVYTSKDAESKLSVTDDGYAFYEYDGAAWLLGYTGLETKLTLPEQYNGKNYSIYPYAFYNESITTVTIGNGVTSIGNSAFSSCKNLASVTIGNGVTAIGEYMFSRCDSLARIDFSGVTSIGNNAFYYCSSLASIDLSGVTSIGDEAFYGCSSLANIDLSGVTSIGADAFYQCEKLTSVAIPDSIQSMDSGIFKNCTALASVVISTQTKSIPYSMFYNCKALTSVYYKGDADGWQQITIYGQNSALESATVYYYSESDPFAGESAAADGNYWHYVDGVPTVWEKKDSIA